MNPYYSEAGITLYHAKMEEVVPRLPAKHFSVLVFDPPYTFNMDRPADVLPPFEGCLTDAAAVLILGLPGGMPTVAEFGHPHARPVDKMREVLEKTSGPILDPYVGVGATLLAAKQLGWEAVGIEMDEKRCAVIVERLRQF